MLAWRESVGRAELAVTDRLGGVSLPPYDELNLGGRVGDSPTAVAENRQRVAAALGVTVGRLVLMTQVHGRMVDVITMDRESAPVDPVPADATVTTVPGLALVALGADCAPIVLADAAAGVVGAVHAGRKGLVVGVVDAAVMAMRELGATDIVARVGPAICGRCYEVPAELRDEVAAVVPAAATTTRWGTPGVDIGGGAIAALRALGIPATQAGGCTYESATLYSHRRDGVTGRHAAIALLR